MCVSGVQLIIKSLIKILWYEGASAFSSDGMSAHQHTPIRQGAFGVMLSRNITYWRNSMNKFYTADGGYRPDTEFDHISNDGTGPLIRDPCSLCPSSMTKSQQERNCVSPLESVFGRRR